MRWNNAGIHLWGPRETLKENEGLAEGALWAIS